MRALFPPFFCSDARMYSFSTLSSGIPSGTRRVAASGREACMSGGRCSSPITSPSTRIIARSTVLRSSRMFPGQA